MKPHIKTAGITAAKWAAGLSAAVILGPFFMGLAVSVDISAEAMAQKLLVAAFSFPIIFVVIWSYGIVTRKVVTAGITIQPPHATPGAPQATNPATPLPTSTNDIPNTADSDKKAGPWNYIWIGIGAF